MTTYKLHTTDLSPFGQRAKLALRVKGQLHDTQLIDTFGGTDALGLLSPMRQIPILEHAGLTLPESQTIVDYLDRVHPNPPLLPGAPNVQAYARLLTRMTDLYIAPHILTLIVGMRPPAQPAKMNRALESLNRGLGFTEEYLAPGAMHAAGYDLTMADLALAPFLFFVPRLTAWHSAAAFVDTPNCANYLKIAETDPYIAKAFTEMETAYKARIDSLKSQESQ